MLLVSNSLWKYKKYILTAEIQARSLFPHFIYYSFQAQNVLQMYVGQCSTSEILRVNVLQMGRILRDDVIFTISMMSKWILILIMHN